MRRTIELFNIRCFSEASFHFEAPRGAFLIGPNGSGKTTILECFILPSRGFLYGAKVSSVLTHGHREGLIRVIAEDDVFKTTVEVFLSPAGRELRINGKKATRLPSLPGMRFASFFPQDISLVAGGPEERREYLDSLLCRAYPSYEAGLHVYRKILTERNAALRHGASDDQISVYDEQLSHAAGPLVRKRLETLPVLNAIVEKTCATFSLFAVRLRYAPTVPLDDDIEIVVREALYARRERDRLEETTTCGPHRDSIEITVSSRSTRYAASYGEKKMVALALRIAEREFLSEITGEKHGFIADDLFSELDASRRSAIVRYFLESNTYFMASATERPLAGEESQGFDMVEMKSLHV
jgi:DNA replication and repair protein RecF